MGPVKFDDLHKTANEVISDDFQTSGYQFKAKQKTSWDGAVITTTADLFGKDDCKTPAKLSWKFPKPLGVTQLSIDKLELDKGGKFKLEASSAEVHKDLKIECKSDLVSMSSAVTGCTYTGLPDTLIKLETKLANAQDFSAEVTRSLPQGLTLGVQTKGGVAGLTAPNIGLRFLSGPYFASLYAKDSFKVFTASCFYKASPTLKCAATYEYGGKKDGSCSLACVYEHSKEMVVKAKVSQDKTLHCSLKNELSKGFTLLTGAKVDSDMKMSYGLQVSIE
jgi:hypothetical protein